MTTTAAQFVSRLEALPRAYDAKQRKASFRTGGDESDEFLGLRMGHVFELAKEFIDTPPDEIEKLLQSPVHEVRVGAVSIMDWQARSKKTTPERRAELFDLYLKCHDRINNWDLVDRGAPHIIGGYLADKPRDVLYELARSTSPWERRTAITATYYFIRQGDVDDTFRIATILAHDPHDLVQKAVGGWVREAGKKNGAKLRAFLDAHAATMPRTALRYAIEHLEPAERQHYLQLKDRR